jgi:5-methylcytosine-specific restriction endonuclease McrA
MTKEYYYVNKSAPDGFNPYCKEDTKRRTMERYSNKTEEIKHQMSEYMKKERRINPERRQKERDFSKSQKESGYYKKYQQENKEKFKRYRFEHLHKKHDITDQEWKSCKEYFNDSCAYCGISEEDAKNEYGNVLHMEHAINNGANDISNCIPACRKCNSSKWTRDFEEWYTDENEIFSQERLNKIHKWLSNDYKLIKQ